MDQLRPRKWTRFAIFRVEDPAGAEIGWSGQPRQGLEPVDLAAEQVLARLRGPKSVSGGFPCSQPESDQVPDLTGFGQNFTVI